MIVERHRVGSRVKKKNRKTSPKKINSLGKKQPLMFISRSIKVHHLGSRSPGAEVLVSISASFSYSASWEDPHKGY